jgi:hypothetical protein
VNEQLRRVVHAADRFVAFRWLLVVTQALSIWVTWPLWQVRVAPPMLPLLDVPQIGYGPLLLASLAVILIHGAAGVMLHSALLLAAMLSDQMRLQPEFISQAILLWGTLPWAAARTVARAHLIALWFYSGFHKLTCPYFYSGDAHWLVTSLFPAANVGISTTVGVSLALAEIGLAVCALLPRTRPLAVWMAYFFHLGIVGTLALGLGWDEAVWPWNAALAAAGYVFIGSWKATPAAQFRQLGVPLRLAVGLILLSPLAYDTGCIDTYLCHVLYSSHAPLAWIRTPDGRRELIDTRPQLKVPVPQIERLYAAYFKATAAPGDELEIFDPRLCSRWRMREHRVIGYERVVSGES